MGNRALWASAVGLPVLAHGVPIFVHVEPESWFGMAATLRRALAADALLYTGACAIVAAPVAGAAVAAARRSLPADRDTASAALGTAWPLIVAVLLFAGVSALLTFGWTAGREDAAAFVARSHVTLVAVALALSAWGAFCGASFRDPLDAAAVSLLVTLVAAGGLLVAGAVVADMPQRMLGLGLAASPLVVIASAARIDIVRMDLLYQISPLAHMQMTYPAWHSAAVAYLALAFTGFAAAVRQTRRGWQP